MANISGTNVSAPIRPFSTDDTYATAVANEIQGGLHIADTKANMFKIPKARRAIGMHVFVEADKRLYRLDTDTTNSDTNDGDWTDILKMSNIIDANGKNVEEKLQKVDGIANIRHIIFNLQDANNTGTNGIELRSPFKAKIKNIDAAVPVGATLDTNGIEFKVEKYDAATTNWTEVKTLKLDDSTAGNAKSEDITGVSVDSLTRFRINITTAMASVKNLEVIITLEVED